MERPTTSASWPRSTSPSKNRTRRPSSCGRFARDRRQTKIGRPHSRPADFACRGSMASRAPSMFSEPRSNEMEENTMRRFCVSLVVVVALGGCGSHSVLPANSLAPAGGGSIIPQVVQKGGGGQWVIVPVATFAALLGPIVTGPNGAMWFLDENAASLAQVSMGERFHEFRVNGLNGNAVALTVGTDGKFYINDET